MPAFERGFKSQANRIALGLRSQLGLPCENPLDPVEELHRFSIEVVPLTNYSSSVPDLVRLLAADSGGFSATLFRVEGGKRIVLHDDSHSPGRRVSDLAHELAHVLLVHPEQVVCTGHLYQERGSLIEAEAAYLGGCILIPNEAAHRMAALRVPLESIAERYGVSEDMARYRLRVSGALKRTGYRP